jgi:hypothetical protein
MDMDMLTADAGQLRTHLGWLRDDLRDLCWLVGSSARLHTRSGHALVRVVEACTGYPAPPRLTPGTRHSGVPAERRGWREESAQVLSWRVAMARNCLSLRKRRSIRGRASSRPASSARC